MASSYTHNSSRGPSLVPSTYIEGSQAFLTPIWNTTHSLLAFMGIHTLVIYTNKDTHILIKSKQIKTNIAFNIFFHVKLSGKESCQVLTWPTC